MTTKTWLKKWFVVAVTMMLLITALGISAIPVLADAPPPAPPDGSLILDPTWNPGTNGTFFDVHVNGGPKLPAWCAQEHKDIYFNQYNPVKIIDYFGIYYPDSVGMLPPAVQNIPWNKVAYIINHKVGTYKEVQQAIWYFTEGTNYTLYFGDAIQADITTMVNAASLNPGFVPGPGQLRPIVYYYNDGTQIVFSEFLTSDVVPPVPEMPAGALLALGLAGVGGYIFIMKRRATAVS